MLYSYSSTDENAYVLGKNNKILYKKAPYYIILAHELIHSLHMINGELTKEKKKNPHVKNINKKFKTKCKVKEHYEELRTIGVEGFFNSEDITENKIRKEHNLRMRISHYHK